MRQHFSYYIELYIIALIIALLIGSVPVINWVSNAIDVNTMNKLGYEAQLVNRECYAKQRGRWVACSVVVHNTIEVTQ